MRGDSKGHQPIQIQSAALRDWKASAPCGGGKGLPMTFDIAAAFATEDLSDLDGHWREEDVRRAIDVAAEAGLQNYRVEIAPDGMISLVVGDCARDGAAE
jgi:hypothetical protein